MKKQIILLVVIFLSSLYATTIEKENILISAQDAISLIGSENVMFVNGDNKDLYKLGHIKGSTQMYAYKLHQSDIMGRMSCSPLFACPAYAANYIGSKAIDNNTLVIAYDNQNGINASAVYAYFKSYGHKNIKILNGGLNAVRKLDPNQKIYDSIYAELQNQDEPAQQETLSRLNDVEANLLVVKGEESISELKSYTISEDNIDYTRVASKSNIVHAMQDILENGKNSDFVIIDSRTMAEIIGEEKIGNVARGGHIPRATFIEISQLYDSNNSLSFKNMQELATLFEGYGVTKDKTIYAYCHVGSGKSSKIVTALEMLGYENAKIYTGSWDEWGNDLSLPIKR